MRPFTFFAPDPAIADVVDAVWDADISDAKMGREIAINVLPAVSPIMCFHYRLSIPPEHRPRSRHPLQTLTGVQTSSLKLRPGGPLGAVMVHLKPETAMHIMGGQMREFTDAHIEICDVLRPMEVSILEERLTEAPGAAARVRLVQGFLHRQIRPKPSDLIVQEAARALRRDPNLPINRLASSFEISERQFERRFQAVVGANPKQFARVVRLGNVVAARRRRSSWADIAYANGFADQAHMVNDFNSMVGKSPEAFFRDVAAPEWGELNVSLGMSDFFNTFIT